MKEKKYSFIIEDITITVIKKRMKNMYLRIKKEDGRVLISAPHQISDARIRAFAEEKIDWIREYQQKYQIADQCRSKEPIDKEEYEWQKRELKEWTMRVIEKWEPVIGVKVSGVTIRQMKTRWGSCNVKTHHININMALLKKEPECLEYVIVHEMCHILEPSHNQVFWGYVERFYPGYKEIRKKLNEEGI